MNHISSVAVKSKHGHDVLVHCFRQKTSEDLHVFHLSGVCGGSTHNKTWTIGSVDGPRVDPPTFDDLQNQLDMFRQEVANEASWKESVAVVVVQLK